ncbi:N2,N2-dimethylguanosine tRNA methyltransferase [Moelleriella libera RCEF 2490]|uniref:tRNA (guanine(26)-N(2))-dimethyltransferase n=1 Tax=Moelleriella libera RCEF 2490 TaxID=1081109 RepID=A0A168F7P5_9HYPO|nr:N2,N2-dimethylguanosine tRNA methyltransferase [Moelleriella libera RCEF 2490]
MSDKSPPTQTVERNGKIFRTISEGRATILVPHDPTTGDNASEEQKVFYNPIQQYNRDLSTLAVKVFGEMFLEKRKESFQLKNTKPGKKRKRDDVEQENGGTQAAVAAMPSDQGAARNGLDFNASFKILDALSASGLRALRYSLEIPFVTSVTANDLSASATQSIKQNAEYNQVGEKLTVSNDDALAVMYRAIAAGLSKRDKHGYPSRSNKFDVIDLDPYGTAAPFFDAAVQAVRDDGGLLVVTCTDSAVWAGHSYCEKSFALYGGVPIKGMHSHEAALRLILNAIAQSGARHGLAIEPMLSLSIDFYTKVFVRVTRSPSAVKFLGAKTMLVYSCDSGCGSWETQPLLRSRPSPNKKGNGSFYKHGMAQGPSVDQHCQHCGFIMHVSGPMYAGRIHSQDFIQRLLDEVPKVSPETYGTLPRLEGMLRTAQEEYIPGPDLPTDVALKDAEAAVVDHTPFYFVPGKVASILSCVTPTDHMFRGALRHLGYRVARSHCRPGSIKTDAPWSTIWWILTEWIKQTQTCYFNVSKFNPNMAGWKILLRAGIIKAEEATEAADEATLKRGRAVQEDEKAAAGESKVDDAPSRDSDGVSREQEGGVKNVPADGEKPQPGDDVTMADAPSDGSKQPLSEEDLRKTLRFDRSLEQRGWPRGGHYLRYQVNPHKNWGPITRAKG